MGWHGLGRSRIRYPLLANAVQRLLTAMVGQDREEANRLQQAKWDLTSRIGMKVTFRTHSISPGDHRSSRGSGPAVPDEVLATTGLGGSARQMSASVFHPSSGRPDCVADDAVVIEQVSASNSLINAINREINREFRRIRPSIAIFVSDRLAVSMAYKRIPYVTEQGIF